MAGGIAAATSEASFPASHGSQGAAGSSGTVTVMPLGDSITRGLDANVAWSQQGGYRTRLWQRTVVQDGDRLDFVGSLSSGPPTLGDKNHEGESGWRIDQLQADVDGWLAPTHPQIVLLHIGTNDILQNDDLAHAPARLADLAGRICQDDPGVRLLVATIIPLPEYASRVNAYNRAMPGALATLPAGCHHQLVDLNSALSSSGGGGDYQQDIRHPSTPQGYDKLADAWYPALTTAYDQLTGRPPPSGTPAGLNGVYYPNSTLTGQAAAAGVDPQVHFSWGTAAPRSGVPARTFSASWNGEIIAPATGRYMIGLQSAGGARLVLDGSTVVDDWNSHSSKWDTVTVTLSAGRHPLQLEYYDNGRAAQLNLSSAGPNTAWATVPSSMLATR